MTAGEEEPRTSLVRHRELAEASGETETLKALEDLAKRVAKPRKANGKPTEGS